MDAARQEVGRAIGQDVAAAWSERASGIEVIYILAPYPLLDYSTLYDTFPEGFREPLT